MSQIKKVDIALGLVVIIQGPSAGTIGIIGG